MQTVVIVVHLMIVTVMIGAVLLQKSEGGGLGMGGGAGFMSSRGTANLLTRTTAILAAGFFVTSLWLAWIAGYDRKPIFDPRYPAGNPIAACRRGHADHPADQRRRSGYAEEGGRAAGPAGAVGPAGATFAIKQGGYAGRRLPSCIRTSHQCSDIALDFTSPTARQNVRDGKRFVLANRSSGLKG